MEPAPGVPQKVRTNVITCSGVVRRYRRKRLQQCMFCHGTSKISEFKASTKRCCRCLVDKDVIRILCMFENVRRKAKKHRNCQLPSDMLKGSCNTKRVLDVAIDGWSITTTCKKFRIVSHGWEESDYSSSILWRMR